MPGMDAGLIQAIIQGAAGTGMVVSGLVNKAKAKKMAKNNIRPEYQIPDTEYQNLSLLNSRASQGLSDSTTTAFNRNNDRALTASLDSILKNGASNNDVSSVADVYTTGAAKLALADDNARMANVSALVSQRQRLSDFTDKAWMINKYAPYADRAEAAKQLASQGENKLWNGISMIAGAGSNYFGNIQQHNDTKDLMQFQHDLKMQEGQQPKSEGDQILSGAKQPMENNIDPTNNWYNVGQQSNQFLNNIDWTSMTQQGRDKVGAIELNDKADWLLQ